MAGMSDSPGEVAEFLARFPPFADLPAAMVADVARDVRSRSYAPSATILRQGADPAAQLFVLRDGLVDLYDDERIVDHLSEGEVFGLSVLSGLGPALSVRARDEVRCLLIPADRAAEVLGTREGLAYLAASVARWAEGASVEHHLRRAQAGEDLAEAIRGAGDVDEVVAASTGLPATIRSLLGDGVDPVDIGHVVGMSIDELSRRFIELSADALDVHLRLRLGGPRKCCPT